MHTSTLNVLCGSNRPSDITTDPNTTSEHNTSAGCCYRVHQDVVLQSTPGGGKAISSGMVFSWCCNVMVFSWWCLATITCWCILQCLTITCWCLSVLHHATEWIIDAADAVDLVLWRTIIIFTIIPAVSGTVADQISFISTISPTISEAR